MGGASGLMWPATVGGPDYNALTADGAAAVEPLAGMSILNGVRVRVEPIPVSR